MSTPGGYTRVAAATRDADQQSARITHSSTDIDIGYGRCDPGSFPRQVWLRSLRRVFTQTPHDRLAYPDGHGAPEFRQAMSAYLNRVRGLQAHPDNALVRTLGSRLPGLRAAGTESGLHVVTWVPDGVDENAIVSAAGAAGVRIGTVGAYRRSPGRPGLIFGYSALTERRIEAGVDQLTAALRLAGLGEPLTMTLQK